MHRLRLYRKMATVSVAMTALVMVFAIGYIFGAHQPSTAVQAQTGSSGTDELFAPFWETWTLLHDNYVDSMDDTALMEGALNGMLDSLGDPHTGYMTPDTFAQINESMSGEYEGIGATVRTDESTGGLYLVTIMDGSPAQAAGLMPGDVIVEVEGEDITGLDQNEIIAQVRGPAGTTVDLGIKRPSETDLLDVEVARERITVASVAYRVLDGDIGYVRLSQFEFSSSQELRDALEAMDANHLKGLVLDVRGNPGGYLTTSIEVASAFMQQGTVVIERGPERERTYDALENAIAPDVPMVVLVDAGSASASELIAGALQDNHRATIVGTKTFGKGSVQTWHSLSNGGGVRITVSRWYTPGGRSVSEVGIDPDVIVPFEIEAGEVYDPATMPDPQLEAALTILRSGEPVQPSVAEPDAVAQ
ncbi:S41 family peptidase [Aggregatilinea lenta]|uniref:S41 family peptidase n=1 Tax=Aggregatilinea lenta TaxID=913108 RepID=UPI000E5A926E|nr:S41 family peptidase [Aggregatilinea lenta]